MYFGVFPIFFLSPNYYIILVRFFSICPYILLSDEKLTELERTINGAAVQNAIKFLSGKTKRSYSSEYKVAFNILKSVAGKLAALEKDFILSNNTEGRYKARLYLNMINSCLK